MGSQYTYTWEQEHIQLETYLIIFLNSFKSSSNTNAIIILCQSALQNFKIAYFFDNDHFKIKKHESSIQIGEPQYLIFPSS